MTKIILNGCLGQMGRAIIALADTRADVEIVAGIDTTGGKTAGVFPVFTKLEDCDIPADCIVDFSVAQAVPSVIEFALTKKIPAVVCTTGLSDKTLASINEAARSIAVFKSANMSLGINLLASVLRRVSKTLFEEGFDIEITERHHRRKVDAPSGTAYLLADAANEGAGGELKYITDRSSVRERRERGELGLTAIRGGTITGEHTVIFAGSDEVIEFTHKAYSREVFAQGALLAARFIKEKPASLYDMADVLTGG